MMAKPFIEVTCINGDDIVSAKRIINVNRIMEMHTIRIRGEVSTYIIFGQEGGIKVKETPDELLKLMGF